MCGTPALRAVSSPPETAQCGSEEAGSMSGGGLLKMMRAIRVKELGPPSVLRLCSDVPVPKPGTGQVLIRVHACGINPVETYIRAGTFARKPALPYTPGSDVAGVVEKVGDGVTAVKAGDRVFTTATESGGYAEYAIAADKCVHKLPDALHFTQGAAIGVPYFTAYRALVQKAHVKPGETVLIHGASGGVGVATCQLSRALGLKVLGTAGTPQGLKLVLNNGAHLAFNHREEGYTHQIMEATDGRGVDVIVEMLSNVNLNKDLQMLAVGGRVTVSRTTVTKDLLSTMNNNKRFTLKGTVHPKFKNRHTKTIYDRSLAAEAPSRSTPETPWPKRAASREWPFSSPRRRRRRSVRRCSTPGWKLVGCVQPSALSIRWTRPPRPIMTSSSVPGLLGRQS